MYATQAEYEYYFGDISEAEFNRYGMEAERTLDIATTGIDGFCKLKEAFPEDKADIIAFCACELMHCLKDIAETGTVEGVKGAVSSMSAGNESITFSQNTAVAKAASDPAEKLRVVNGKVSFWLSGLEDANGVSLLFKGRYPNVQRQSNGL